jgi:hypothetical protein
VFFVVLVSHIGIWILTWEEGGAWNVGASVAAPYLMVRRASNHEGWPRV